MTVAALKSALDPIVGAANVIRWEQTAPGQTLPYVALLDEVAVAPSLAGDGHTQRWRTTLQVSLFQYADSEDDTLRPQIVAAIDGMTDSDGLRYGVTDWQRLIEGDGQQRRIAHTAISVRVHRRRGT